MRLSRTPATIFQEKPLPSNSRLVGWAALVHALSVKCPIRHPSCASDGHIKGSQRENNEWTTFDTRYWPGDDFGDHLGFALRHENLDLLVIKRIFQAIDPLVLEGFVRKAPIGVSNRRAWFLYELLMGQRLDIPDAPHATAIDLLDPKAYFIGRPRVSSRHRVRNNLLGTAAFCPIIRRTPSLTRMIERNLGAKANEIVGQASAQLVVRAASFLLLADSRASFEIEGERPLRGRLERWGRAVLQAGRNTLNLDELIRLHGILIEDSRFVKIGLRPDGVFLGERDVMGDPLPEFIGARSADLTNLMNGLLDTNERMRESQIDPVLQAAATAFGFVYVHPFQDGNGRLHRCLIHHVLAERKFTPKGIVFPVSSVMLDQIDRYRETLQAHSAPLMHFIEWRSTPERNVELLNDTSDLYRYFDCTEAAEFLYECVQRTVDNDLPKEIEYLRRQDEAIQQIMETVEMPDDLAGRLVMFIRQNQGRLGKKRREGEFKKLTDHEVAALESIVRAAFADLGDYDAKPPLS